MKLFLMVVGFMALCWILQDVLRPISKALDDFPLLCYPLAFVCYICLVLSAPIGLYVAWHDSRLREIQKQIFLEDHQK